VLLVGVPSTFPDRGGTAQLFWGLLVCFGTFGAYMMYAPFVEDSDDHLSQVAQLQIFLTLLSSLALRTTPPSKLVGDMVTIILFLVPCIGVLLETPIIDEARAIVARLARLILCLKRKGKSGGRARAATKPTDTAEVMRMQDKGALSTEAAPAVLTAPTSAPTAAPAPAASPAHQDPSPASAKDQMLGLIETIQREGVGMDDELRLALGKLGYAPSAMAPTAPVQPQDASDRIKHQIASLFGAPASQQVSETVAADRYRGLAVMPSQAAGAQEAKSVSGKEQGLATNTLSQEQGVATNTSAGAAEPQSQTADDHLIA